MSYINGVYMTAAERANYNKVLNEKEGTDRHSKRAQLDEYRLKSPGMEKYHSSQTATTTGSGVSGSAAKHELEQSREYCHRAADHTKSTEWRQPQQEYSKDEFNLGYTKRTEPNRHHDTYDDDYKYGEERLQRQETMKQQRSIQASMQMAYSVFGNVITALETYEGREARRARYTAPRKSNIPIPDQAFKNDEDVKASLMSQLKVFETHLQFCPKQVRDDVTSDMKIMVAQWLSARDDPKRFAPTKTDHYAARLFEILAKGSTTHADFSKHQRVMGRTELMSNFQKVMKGQAKADDLDRSFRDDPRKTASRPDVRRGTDINKGLRRIDLCNAALSPYTKELKEPSTRIR